MTYTAFLVGGGNSILVSFFIYKIMSKDSFYFSHDYNARSDPKIKRLLAKHGLVGYGIYWAIIEDLYNNANALPTDYDVIAFDLRVDEITIKSIINDFDLFQISGEYFGSFSVERRLNQRQDKSLKAKESALLRWRKANNKPSEKDANALPSQSECNAIKERKGNKRKEKEIIDIYPFEDFWNDYDKKRGEIEKIKSKWAKLTNEEKELIKLYIPKYKTAQPDKAFRKDPATFLNNKSWNDEIITPKAPISPKKTD